MYKPVNVVEVIIWGERVGAASLDTASGYYAFEYDKKWIQKNIELSPFNLSLKNAGRPVVFAGLPEETFKRLPAMLADALPDKFGNALIDAALSEEGVPKERVTPLDRLAYMSNRSMGALEFRPPRGRQNKSATAIQLSLLVEGARKVLEGKFDGDNQTEAAIRNIIQVGISAGGARAKAVIAWNPNTKEVRSGHVTNLEGFEHWLLKLDGVGKDLALGSGAHYGRIEYAYHLMSSAAGISMMRCELLEENGRAHFMTKRFDRDGTTKHHIQTLCAMRHIDFNAIGVHSYNQYFEAIRGLGMSDSDMREGFRRMVFNVVSANCDDHSKNFSFMLKQGGNWEMTPAYDITHAHNPENKWTRQHLMSVNGKFDQIDRADFMSVADRFQIPSAHEIIDGVIDATGKWREFAAEADVPDEETERIEEDIISVRRHFKVPIGRWKIR